MAKIKSIDGEHIESNDGVRIEFVELGEGLHGDFGDTDDPNDYEVLRYDIMVKKGREWETPQDSSYATLIPVSTSEVERKKILQHMMGELHDRVKRGDFTRCAEQLSWLENSKKLVRCRRK